MPSTYGGAKNGFIRHAFTSSRHISSSVSLSPTKHEQKNQILRAEKQNIVVSRKIVSADRSLTPQKKRIAESCTNRHDATSNSRSTGLTALFACLDGLATDNDESNDRRLSKRRKTTFFGSRVSNYYNPSEDSSNQDSSDDSDASSKDKSQETCVDKSIGTIIKQFCNAREKIDTGKDLNKCRARKLARYTTFVRNMSLKGRTYESTRSFRADERTISDDDDDDSSVNDDVIEDSNGINPNPNRNLSSLEGLNSDKVLSTLDLRTSGINTQNKEELELFVEGYEAETSFHNRKDVLEEFLEQIRQRPSFAKYICKFGFPAMFLNQSLRKDSKVEDICGLWVMIFMELLKSSTNSRILSSFCRAIPNQPEFILTLLHSKKDEVKSSILKVLCKLVDVSTDFDITRYFQEGEQSEFIKELRTCIESSTLSTESTDHCLRIYHQMVLTGNVGDELSFYKLTLSIMKFVRDHTKCEQRKLASILKLGISLTSSLNQEEDGLRKKIRDVLFNREVFSGLIEITISNIGTQDGNQLALFALGYLVNFADESKYLQECDRSVFKKLKKVLHDNMGGANSQTAGTHVEGYLALVYGKLLTYKSLNADLSIDEQEKVTLINVLRRFEELVSSNIQIKRKVDLILKQLESQVGHSVKAKRI